MFGKFKEFVLTRNLPECKKFISDYVKEVVVYRDHIEVIFNVVFSFTNNNIRQRSRFANGTKQKNENHPDLLMSCSLFILAIIPIGNIIKSKMIAINKQTKSLVDNKNSISVTGMKRIKFMTKYFNLFILPLGVRKLLLVLGVKELRLLFVGL